jgi:hypothetical protein
LFMGAINRVILSIAVLFSLIVVCLGCGTKDKHTPSAEHLSFKVVDSLLAPTVEIGLSGKQFNPPLGFKPTSDSILAVLREQMAAEIGIKQGVELSGCFLDPRHSAAVLLSTVNGLALAADTFFIFSDYRQSLREVYAGAEIREGEYWVHELFVKNFLITDSSNVRFQLLCLSAEGNGAELIYYAPRVHYPKLVRYFESSIGSLKPINQGG